MRQPRSNYVLQRTGGDIVRFNQPLRPARPLNTALVRLYSFVARCFRGEASLTEASVGFLYFGGILVGTFAYLVLLPFGGEHAPPVALFTVALFLLAFALVAAVAVWRCAYNTRYEGVAIGARALALGYVACTVAFTYGSLSAV